MSDPNVDDLQGVDTGVHATEPTQVRLPDPGISGKEYCHACHDLLQGEGCWRHMKLAGLAT